MQPRTKRTALFLSLLLLAAVTASCADGSEDGGGVTDSTITTAAVAETEAVTAAPDSLEARKQVSDDVPELDFEGKEYRIFYQKRYTTDAIPETDEETGDVLNDAVYRRNKTVEERFNVSIVGIEGEEDAMVKTLMSAVAAGEDAYELFMGHSMYSGKAALSGYFYNWYDIPYMDFTKPWFPEVAVEGLNINDRMYMTVSDMCLSFVSNAYCMYFNKKLAADYDIEDIYGMVSDGTWTIDNMASIAKGLYKDLNGNGTKDADDQYGFGSTTSNHTATWTFACDVDTVEFGDDGTVTSVFNSERATNMIAMLRDLYNENEGSFPASVKVENSNFRQSFMNGNTLFITEVVGQSEWNFRDVEFDYGIVPFPKYDEAQEAYYTIPGGSVSCMAVPASTTDIEIAGAVTAALCRESWVSVLPDYYDIVLKVKGARDETSIEMLDIIMDGRKVDATFLYDAWSGYTYTIEGLITGNKELASFVASKDKSVIKHYEKVIELFYSEEN